MNDDDRSKLTLDEYQVTAALTDLEGSSDDPMVPLLGLAGEVGALIAEFKKKRRPDGGSYSGFDDLVVEELGDILWYLAALARRVDVSMSVVADVNLQKTRARWLPGDGPAPTSFDDGFPPDQRLPRRFSVEFSTYAGEAGPTKVRMKMFGEVFGDPIDDNARYDDHYRFHDVFHLSYAAVLGWSPVLRSLIARKRRADAVVDRVEDGARAYATEEAVAALVFELAKGYSYFEGASHVDDLILDAVKAVTARLEVGERSVADWQKAILIGFRAWRAVAAAGGGIVDVDLDSRTLSVRGQLTSSGEGSTPTTGGTRAPKAQRSIDTSV